MIAYSTASCDWTDVLEGTASEMQYERLPYSTVLRSAKSG